MEKKIDPNIEFQKEEFLSEKLKELENLENNYNDMAIYQNEQKKKLLKIQEELFTQSKNSEKLINLNDKENQHLIEEFNLRSNKKALLLRNIDALENRIKNVKIDYLAKIGAKEQEIKYLKSVLDDNVL